MQLFTLIGAALVGQRGHLFHWVPVCLSIGIGGYFALLSEPGWPIYGGLAVAVTVLSGLAWHARPEVAPLIWAVMLIAAGVALAGARAHAVAEPVLGWRYYGPVEGRVVGIDRSGSDALRLTLDRVVLRDTDPARTPARVRVSLHGDRAWHDPAPGQVVILTAHLSPPSGPVEPGGFDFRRHAWFQGVGAVGYSRTPVLLLEPNQGGMPVFAARMVLSDKVQRALPDEVGAFAAAIMTGDRSGMGQDTLEALRASNLAHLLAISGLHMGLLAGFVFAAFRLGFAAAPVVGLRLPAKKLSAGIALSVAAGYLLLSGGNIATERAFVMVAVMLIAVMFDRRALSLRAVAVAALIVLVWRPEALLGPGFQMSFAATTALVAVFGVIRDQGWTLGPRWLRPVMAVVISSAVAGAATGPVGAAHFNQLSHFGLPANLLSVPLMGVLVMPSAVVAALLMPFGAEGPALWIMGLGLRWILGVAHWVAGLDGALGQVVSPPWAVLPTMAFGALVVILWQGRARWTGLGACFLAAGLWVRADRPLVLIDATGNLVGVMTDQGRALSKPRGAGFAARNWLENDGDGADQAEAAVRWPETVRVNGLTLRALSGKRAATNATCLQGEWLISNVVLPENLPCRVTDPHILSQIGALAVYSGDPSRIISVRDLTGVRLWSVGPKPRKQAASAPAQ
ncbi:competence protein ComEC [Thalassovita taeanensis]|uniref:Competence protein ComEC n=1 Tax=Thalassovita taeanensis TaxID=657014 RepID=A0A1H8YVV1_9RHOB|nr:competence protein ComEC [Thalassovita taeanensis]